MNSKRILLAGTVVSALILSTGCQSGSKLKTATATPTPAVAPAAAPMAIRIDAGNSTPFTNTDGTVWLADQGFADGETVERPDIEVAKAGADQEVYHTEHYGMSDFSQPVPNGKYTVKLHFAETYDGITDKGERVFSFNIQGQDFKDFDVFDKAGGALRACVVTVPVEVTNGKLDITFTSNIENPEINGIEIIPNS